MIKDKIPELKKLYEEFKTSSAYADRVAQSPVTKIFKEIIAETLKKEPITNQDFTDLIQIFKFNSTNENFDKKLIALVKDEAKREELSNQAYALEQPGYTNAGKTGITGLNQGQLNQVKQFLLAAYTVVTKDEAIKLCKDFEALNVPQIKKGVFSIWLHYINPQIFPVLNNSHNNFKSWIGLPDEYSASIEPYHQIKEVLGEENLGVIDFFAYHFTPQGKLNYTRHLNLNGRALFKVSHGAFVKNPRFTNLNFIETLEKNEWISISSYTGKGAGEAFEKEIKIGDIVYVCYGGDSVYCIGEVISDSSLFPSDIAKLIGDDEEQEWLYRKIKPLYWPIDKSVADLKGSRSQTMPSGNSTLWQIKDSDLERMNDELFLPKFNLEITNENKYNSIVSENNFNISTQYKMALNTIMYGPPGTGKTYNTISYAVAIIENKNVSEIEQECIINRDAVKARYDNYINSGLIVFTTFHQSMSYEEFIEGIKPLPPEKDQALRYDIEDGIFKNICNEAEDNWFSFQNKVPSNFTFEDILEILKEEWAKNKAMKFSMKTEGKEFTITGFTKKSINFRKASGGEGHSLSINTLKNIFYKKREAWGKGVGIYYPGIIEKLEEFTPNVKAESTALKNYVLIIDEINRGNVSQIFGELITLIEDDKRIGGNEALKINLPYSKDDFGVPPNLYIVGTMNTADRSVEALDTALRRRFNFVEKMPNPDLLKESVSGISLQQLLIKINERIELLLDRDHTIGHSYFINIKKDDTLALKSAFQNKILPLLQEYFYGDYGKIGLVLGTGFVNDNVKPNKTPFAPFKYPNGNDQFVSQKCELIPINDDFKIIEALKTLMSN